MICWLQPRLNAPVYNRSCRDNNNPFFLEIKYFCHGKSFDQKIPKDKKDTNIFPQLFAHKKKLI
jgi:hypothetical protein